MSDEPISQPWRVALGEMAGQAAPQPYDWHKSLKAGLHRAGLALGGVVVAAIVQALQDPALVTRILGTGKLAVALVPAVVGLASAFANWWKNKDR